MATGARCGGCGRTVRMAGLLVALVGPGLAWAAGPPCGSPPCGGPPVPAAATVTVDCDAGGSVQEALATPAAELTVEIRGICHEDVVVSRDRVTLSGRSPALDGLRGVGQGTATLEAVLRVVSASKVRVENLSIADGARTGVNIDDFSIDVAIAGCEITGAARDGLQATGDSSVITITDTAITGHGRAALSAFDADFVRCIRCTLEGATDGAMSLIGSRVILQDSTVHGGSFAVFAGEGGALVSATNSVLTTGAWGPGAQAGEVFLNGGSFEGSIYAINKGLIALNGATHAANPQGFNVLGADALVSLSGSTAQGYTVVEGFSTFILRNGSVLDGDLVCPLAGDAWCDDATVDVTGQAGCDHCSTPMAALGASLGQRSAPPRFERPVVPMYEP